ncbi:MAG TPA: radical SAM protein [Candidatus Nanoarchaeia archaeon]|nr:radical SAM protein [Candidatus Nanoarchaeia archaeon]
MKYAYFSRAIFISWFCSIRDCKFCYLSSKENQSPIKDRRSLPSILAEALVCKAHGWPIEFISGGCDTYKSHELANIIEKIYEITGQKQWLNLGVLDERKLKMFKPYIDGITGTVECLTPGLREFVVPSKPLDKIEGMFEICDKLGIKKAITFIVGLGETIDDFKHLEAFVKKHHVDRITMYRLKPVKGTYYENAKGPSSEYYLSWIRKTREAFPSVELIAGMWLTHLDEVHLLFEAGADAVSKFPAIREFGTDHAFKIEEEAAKSGRKFQGSLTRLTEIDADKELMFFEWDSELKGKIKEKLTQYIALMESNIPKPLPYS